MTKPIEVLGFDGKPRFGSEAKWVAEDHDGRLTYLDEGTVVGWQEMPVLPEKVYPSATREWR